MHKFLKIEILRKKISLLNYLFYSYSATIPVWYERKWISISFLNCKDDAMCIGTVTE